MDTAYWEPFVEMLRTMVQARTISADDLDLMLVTDSIDEAIAHIERHAIRRFGLTTRPGRRRGGGSASGRSRRRRAGPGGAASRPECDHRGGRRCGTPPARSRGAGWRRHGSS